MSRALDTPGPGPRGRTPRAIGRRLVGVCALLLITGLVYVTAIGAAVYTILTAPMRLRLGRARRVLAIAVTYASIEIVGLAVASWRWVRFFLDRDADRDREDLLRSLRRSLHVLRKAAHRFAGLEVILVPGPDERTPAEPELPAGPLIVCSRHGGPGGAFLLAHLLLSDYGRVPRVVLKQTLAWDPLLDALLSRLPHAFIDPDPGDGGSTASRIGMLARGMGPDDALLIFPEGGNFTPRRRLRAISRLRRRGLFAHAARAERLRHVLPPRPDGLFAALEAAPESDVVFVAHTGLDHLLSTGDVWRAIPLAKPVVFTWWAVSAAEVPRQEELRLGWLEDNWARIDRWVDRNRIPL